MARKSYSFIFGCIIIAIALSVRAQAATLGRRTLFDDSWRFKLDTIADGYSARISDNDWRVVNLPHDWSVEAEFDKDAPAGNDGGYLPTGTGWYRKSFSPSAQDEGKTFRLYFEGVYMNAEVFVNGQKAGEHPYGYSSFFCDITPYLRYGSENLIAVKADNSKQKNCRWYSGSGIYRHVWLLATPATYIDEWSVGLRSSRNGDGSGWTLTVDAHAAGEAPDVEYRHSVLDREGRVVAEVSGKSETLAVQVENPNLWSTESPYLYTVKTQLVSNGKVVDEVMNTTGFRTVEFDTEKGLRLNGKPVLLNGGCVHHDNGVLGAKSFDAAEARKVALLKEAGFNAVRTSHNVPSEAFLRECDRQGLLVIDEAFDGWRDAKNKHDYSVDFDNWWERDIEAMVLRDRNHPSIFCWSIGNEVIERKKLEVLATARKLAEHVRRFDPSRPVTSALTTWDNEWEIFDPLAAVHDIAGYNYQLHRAESDHARVPSRVVMQTESYPRDAFANWDLANKHPYILGDFVWTALDYLGESGIGRFYYKGESEGEHFHRNQYPWHGAYCGDIDITGWRKPISHYRQMLYNGEPRLYMAVKEPDSYHGEIKETSWSVWPTWESWNWPGHEGKEIEVEVCSRYPKVRLLLNDTVVGEKPTGYEQQFKALFTLPYRCGILRAVATDENGNELAATTLETTGEAYAIRLRADKSRLAADGQDLAFVVAEIIDRQGRVVPDASNRITFSIAGAGTIEATGSADMRDEESYSNNLCKVWKGRGMAVVRTGTDVGKIRLRAHSPGLKAASLSLHSR